MSERILHERRKLHNYSALDGLNGFLEKIVDNADRFAVISATERRCYNIAVRFLPFLNIVSNNALLLMYSELANVYEETGELPKILIIDDIMIHGRGLSKFLLRLEATIIEELKHRGHLNTSEDYLFFRMQFTKAITIYIYGKNSGALLLAPRFLSRIEAWEEMYVGKLRNLSLQLSDCLNRWDIANTSYAYSIRNSELAQDIERFFSNLSLRENEKLNEALMQMRIDSKLPRKDLSKQWIPLVWTYNNENMYIFIRLFGKEKIERISTIRYFPTRAYKEAPLITSYTLLGDISIDTLDSVCEAIADRLSQHNSLTKTLSNRNRMVCDVKGQLLNTLISLVDFSDFCETTFGRSYPLQWHTADDLRKVARNYSLSLSFFDELRKIANSKSSQTLFHSVFSEFLYERITPLIDKDIDECYKLWLSSCNISRIVQRINVYAARSVYHLGAEAERGAVVKKWGLEESQRDAYSELDFSLDFSAYSELDLTHGVLPMRICAKNMAQLVNDRNFTGDGIFCLIASLVAIMDNGVISVRQAKEGNKLVSMAKAGELAVFYIPNKFSLFIPAFVEIEKKYYGNSMKLIEQLIGFVEKYLEPEDARKEISMFIAEKEGTAIAQTTEAITKAYWDAFGDKKRYKRELHRFYSIGHSFRGWDFLNLTHQNDAILSAFQTVITDFAKNSK